MKQLLLSLIGLFVSCNVWAYDFKNGDFYYNVLSESTVEITYDVHENSSYEGVIHIPATVENDSKSYSVVAIGEGAFYKSQITDIHIPNTIKKIGKHAFRNSTQLVNVTLPMGITTLPEYLFEGTAIIAIAIPDGVKEIGSGVFQACKKLSTVFMPSQLTKIASYGFYACHALTEIYNLAITPPNATAFAVFQGLEGFDVIVPDNSVSIYQTTAPWSNFSIYPSESFTMTMTVQGVRKGDYDEILLGDAKAYKIYYNNELIAVTAAESYYIPNDGTPKTYQVVPTNYFFDAEPHDYTTIENSSVGNVAADDITIRAASGNIFLEGDIADKNVTIYDVYGNLYYNASAKPVITLDVHGRSIFIVKCGSKVTKVIL